MHTVRLTNAVDIPDSYFEREPTSLDDIAVFPEITGIFLPLQDLAEDNSDTKALVSEQLADLSLAWCVRTLATNNKNGYCVSNQVLIHCT